MSLTLNRKTPTLATRIGARDHAAVRTWLDVVILLVLAMIVVGGATRLTDSGLSITEWQPILGVIPPLTDADWQLALEKYRQIPEYQEINRGMSMAAFQYIYWWEWAHRFLGRIIGVAYAIPLFVFLWFRQIPGRLVPLAVALLVLGGLQGAIGWYMVQSGLVDRVDVSQYRLALHLSVAFLILSLLTWFRLQVTPRAQTIDLDTVPRRHKWLATGLLALIGLQVALGAFVAGLKAGLTYNTWPLMNGAIVPPGLLDLSPWYLNATENITAVQFNHRMTAYLLVGLAVWHAIALWRTADDRHQAVSALVLMLAVLVQAAVGIWTLLAVDGAIPIGLGLAHQGGAAIVLMIAVIHWERMRRGAAAH